MNGTDQNQNGQTGSSDTMIGNEHAFNFKPEQLNRFLKMFNTEITFTYGQRQVSAKIIQAKNMGDNTIEIACRDNDLRYDIVLNIKTRHARVVRVYPLQTAIRV
jgi:hypothetical protein